MAAIQTASMAPPVPILEQQRLLAVRSSGLLDTRSHDDFDKLTREAADQSHCPMALLSVIDHRRQLPKSLFGLDFADAPREVTICAYTILCQPTESLVVPDTLLDHRFSQSPFVVGYPHIRFYLGAPIMSPDGFAIGSLCVMDHQPRMQIDEQQVRAIVMLAGRASKLIETVPSAQGAQELNEADLRIGLRIRQARLSAGLSQSEVASRVGITVADLEDYEIGRRRAVALTLLALSVELGVRLSYLVQDL
ncbi:MAG: GAF domain-containing protein [Pseudomonadota bacterium]